MTLSAKYHQGPMQKAYDIYNFHFVYHFPTKHKKSPTLMKGSSGKVYCGCGFTQVYTKDLTYRVAAVIILGEVIIQIWSEH